MMNFFGETAIKVIWALVAVLFFVSCNEKGGNGPIDSGVSEFDLSTDLLGGDSRGRDKLIFDMPRPDMFYPPKTEWVAMDEGYGMGSSRAYGIAVDKASNVYAVGSFFGTMSLGGNYHESLGQFAMFWIRLSNKGTFNTFQQAGASKSHAKGNGVALDNSGNVIVVGGFVGTINIGKVKLKSAGYYDIFIAKFSPSGKELWAVSAGGTYVGPATDEAFGVATGPQGDIYIRGLFAENATFGDIKLKSSGKHSNDVFVAKIDSSGKFRWVVRLDKSVGGSYLNTIAADKSGNCYISGPFLSSATFGTTKLTGNTYVARINPGGKFDWAVSAVGCRSTGIAVDSAGNSYITGDLQDLGTFGNTTIDPNGVRSGFSAKVSPKGKYLWVKSFGFSIYGPFYSLAQNIAVDHAGNSYVTGLFTSSATFGPFTLTSYGSTNIYVAKFSPAGEILWAVPGGSSNTNNGGVAVDANQNVYVSGDFKGKANFGGIPKNSLKTTFFVWKLASGKP